MLPIVKNYNNLPSLIDDIFGRNWFENIVEGSTGRTTTPAVNVYEDKDDYRIEVAAPGLKKENFKLDLNQRVLSITSEKMGEQKEEQGGKFIRKEFSYNSFCRTFALPSSVNAEKISAKYEEGILTVLLPKKEEAKVISARQIAIS
ncbi:MAG TPA: Hsp20/alpha crystallin family protein [Williamwhitmania sp.]|nr:Hsp20/alpha crystallin family protein [Williamwhitmania sp.]